MHCLFRLNLRFTAQRYFRVVYRRLTTFLFTKLPRQKNLLLELLHQQKIALVIDSIKSDDSTLVNEVIHEEPNVVVCRKTHPRINGQINTKQFFKEKHCVLTDEWAVNQTTNHNQYLNNVQVETVASSLSGVVLNVIESDNIAIIPQSFAMKWKEQLGLQVIDLPIESNLVTYHFIYHKREKKQPAPQAYSKQHQRNAKTILQILALCLFPMPRTIQLYR